VRGHIATMAKRLTRALAMIDPAPARDREQRRARLVALALQTADEENQRMLARKVGWGGCVLWVGGLTGVGGERVGSEVRVECGFITGTTLPTS
jgi:hypothetical protein